MKTAGKILGFTLIELMIVVALFAFLLLMAAPSIGVYLENSKVRTTPESIVAGMQMARFHAIKTNHRTQFALTTAADSTNNGWVVREEIPAATPADAATVVTIETFVWGAGGKNWTTVNAVATDAGGNPANAVTFNGMGQPVATNTAWAAPAALANSIAQINVTSNTGMEGVIPLRINVGARGIRVCAPHLDTTGDPKACNP
jgi:type IV fimbrial biogenesis protein FimT